MSTQHTQESALKFKFTQVHSNGQVYLSEGVRTRHPQTPPPPRFWQLAPSKLPADSPWTGPSTWPRLDGVSPRFRVARAKCARTQAKPWRACSCKYGQMSSPNSLQEAKLFKNWPKHALKLTPGPLGVLPVPICPQNRTVFPKTCLQLTLSMWLSQWPGEIWPPPWLSRSPPPTQARDRDFPSWVTWQHRTFKKVQRTQQTQSITKLLGIQMARST